MQDSSQSIYFHVIVNNSFAAKSLAFNVLYGESSTRINIMVSYVLNSLSSVNLKYSVPLSPEHSELQKPVVLILGSENSVITVNNQESMYSFPHKEKMVLYYSP